MRASNWDTFLWVTCAIIMVTHGRKQTRTVKLPGSGFPIPFRLANIVIAHRAATNTVGIQSAAFGLSVFMFIRGKMLNCLT